MKQNAIICALLTAAVVGAYWPVGRNAFVMLDDGLYVFENPHVQQGLTWEGFRWALTTGHAGNWHPVTWFSHMTDCQIFGLNPAYHHGVSVLLHGVNSVLLYLVLKRMTRAVWRSAVVAALFALHPLHVESVAWAAERKDVLSTLFWILTLAAYVRYTAVPGWRSYGLVVVCFVLGLMAKPMLVTLPFVLLLLDYWPLRRLRPDAGGGQAASPTTLPRLILEKIPLLILSLASCLVTFAVQQRGGAVRAFEIIPPGMRLANALVAYAAYLGKMLWPSRLAVCYPYASITTWQWLAAGALLAVISLVAIGGAKRRPYLAVGWLWYLGTLVPVIGLVQVGDQAMADRYTYVPLIGVFLMIVWTATDLTADGGWGRSLIRIALVPVLVGCLLLSLLQVSYWRNSLRLFEHAVQVTKDNAIAHCNLGFALHERRQLDQAIVHYREALRIEPGWAMVRNNLGAALATQGNAAEAVEQFRAALAAEPGDASTHGNLGRALSGCGQFDQALTHYREALRLAPEKPFVYSQLAWFLVVCPKPEFRDSAEALPLAEQAARLAQGTSPAVLDTLAAAYAAVDRFPEAVREAEQALALAKSSRNNSLAAEIAERLELYKRQQPFREAAPSQGGMRRRP
ncbi:MAG: tetratricopeptide repeat protein [Planctomycetota bacterium]|nr:tetratricopeptide repeat protein [Planctomycetota bacterium]